MKTPLNNSRRAFLPSTISFCRLLFAIAAAFGLFVGVHDAGAQSSGDYRTAAGLTSGNWNGTSPVGAATVWETFNGAAWIATSTPPTSANGVITILSGAVVTMTAAVTIDQTVINSGGELIFGTGVTPILAHNTSPDLLVNGTLLHQGTSWTFNSGATWTVGAGGTYIHNTTGSAATPLGAATLNAASTWIYRGSSTLSPPITFSARTYGNLQFESTSGTYTVPANTGTQPCTINGNLLVGATGAGTVNWTITSAAVTSAFGVGGSLSVGSASTLSLAAIPITLAGNLTNNGTLSLNSSSGVLTFNGTSSTVAGSAVASLANGFTVNASTSVSLLQDIAISTGTATVNGALNCGVNNITGAGTFTLASGASLGIGSANGIVASLADTTHGNIRATAARNFNTGANYTYNGSSAQVTGTGLPTTVNNLTNNNSVGTASGGVTLSGNVTVNGQLGLTQGRFITGANQITIADAASISPAAGASGSYVDGALQKTFASTGTKAFTFAIGSGTVFAPCAVTSLLVTTAGSLTATTTGSEHPNISSSTIDPTQDANRYWTLTAGGGLLASSYTATCTPVSADLDGGATIANFILQKWNGTSWAQASSTSVAGNSVTGFGLSSFGDLAVGQALAGLTTSPSGTGIANPASAARGATVLLSVAVTPGANPASTGINVIADLSSIGGSSTQPFYDDGTHGDLTNGDNVFSYSTTLPLTLAVGGVSLPATITDAQSRSGSATILLSVVAGTHTWAGGATDNNWSSAANWNSPPATNGDMVVFAGTTRLAPSLDTAYSVSGLTFDGTAGSFILGAAGGSALTLGGGLGLTNNSANPETVNLPLILGALQTINAAGSGILTISGGIDNGGNLLTLTGANNSVISGAISNSGGLTMTGSGTATLSGSNTYSGTTTVTGGTLALSGGTAIPDTGTVILANNPGVTLGLNANETVGSVVAGGATNATIALGANNLSVSGTGTNSAAITGTGKLIQTGAGTLTLDRATAYGPAFTLRAEGGTVDLDRNGNALSGILGTGNTVELAGGTLQLSGIVQANFVMSLGALNIYSNSTIRFNRTGTVSTQTTTNTFPLNFLNNATLSFAYNANITGSTSVFDGAANTLQGNATFALGNYTVTVVNPVGESGGSFGITKTGAGELNLNGINTYSGDTTNLAGILGVNGTSTLGNGSGTLVLAGGDMLSTANHSSPALANPILMTGTNTNNIYGNSTATPPSTRILALSGTLNGTSGTLRVGNTGLASNTFILRLQGGGFTFPQPIIVGDSTFDTAGAISELELANDNTTTSQVFSEIISGGGSLIRDALTAGTGGTTILSGTNTFTGGTTVTTGFIGFGTNSTTVAGAVVSGPVGTGTLEIDNDANVGIFASGGPRVIDNQIFLNGVTNLQINGSNDLTLTGLMRVGTVAKTLTINNTGQTVFSGVLSNAAPLAKAGPGILVLTGANTSSGGFSVVAGTLLVNNPTGSGTGTGSVTNSGGTLSGTGTITGPVIVQSGGTLQPGLISGDTSTLTINNTLTLAGTAMFSLNRNNPQTASEIAGITTLTKGGTLTVSNAGAALQPGDTFTLFNSANQSGSFATTNLPALASGQNWWTTDNYSTLTVNQLTSGNATYIRPEGLGLKIAISDLLTNVTSIPSGDTFNLVSVGTSGNGVTPVINGDFVIYTPAPNNNANDSFSYTAGDSRGGSVTGQISIVVTNLPGAVLGTNTISLIGTTATISTYGIPNYNYVLQTATNLSGPWLSIQTNVAATNGFLNFTDTNAIYLQQYYRTAQP